MVHVFPQKENWWTTRNETFMMDRADKVVGNFEVKV